MRKLASKEILIVLFGCIMLGVYWINVTPMVSVIMPVYNREKLVGRAISSILKQSYTDFEFIIIDDGSTDGTVDVLKKYAEQDRRIKLFINVKNKGIAFSRNRGLSIAKGKYIAIMDSDDFSEPKRLERSVKFMEKHPEIDILSGGLADINSREEKDLYDEQDGKERIRIPGEIEINLMFYNVVPNITTFIRKSFIVDNRITYNPAFLSAEDYDFWKSCVFAGAKFARINNILSYVGREDDKRPQNYYNFMTDNSLEIHRQFFSLFFRPTQDELKFSYSTKEKCSILWKMVQNPSKIIDQTYVVNAYNRICPIDLDTSFYLIHDNWTDYLVPQKESGRYKRQSVDDYATIIKTNNYLTVNWDKWPTEHFMCNHNECTLIKH